MKHLLLAGALGVGIVGTGCTTAPTDEAAPVAPATVKSIEQFFATTVANGRAYESLQTVRLTVPDKAMPGEQWFQHRYRLTDSTGQAVEQVDTAVVQADGQVLYY